ncbi:hypothetical protein PORY_001270 [Pneumocystis oryctolagi]|uniref:Uncharacterized protein n=1 Tax=Pneumocystis oryctolagi TaxID=42067 RepID=A0ACB7CCH3_9ASCO|nr:hypothetical protein PORY_001270 [Pneumocystis oryctolagi]
MENTDCVDDIEYELLEVIGHGSFGMIRKVRRKSDGMIFARKEIHYRKMEERERKQLASEVHILSNLRHPHIVRYFGRIFRDGEISVKLGDFGLSRILDDPSRTFAQTYVGTPYYMSPEIINHEPYTAKSDIWALGCTMYEMCTKLPPFRAMTQSELNHKIRRGIFPPISGLYSMTLRDTIRWCLAVDPKRRPMASDLLMIDMFRAYRKELEVLQLWAPFSLIFSTNDIEANVLAKEEELKNRERILYEKEMNLEKVIHARVCRTQSETDRFYTKSQEIGHSGERPTNRLSAMSSAHTIASLHCSSPVKDKRHTTIDSSLAKLSSAHFSPGERRQLTVSNIPIRQPLQENTSKLSNTVSKNTPVTPSRLRVSPNSRKTLDSPLHTQGLLRNEVNIETNRNLRNPRPTVMEMWRKNAWEDEEELPSPFLRKNVTILN